MLFTFDGKEYGPALYIDKAFVAYVRGQSEEAGFQTVPPPGFEYVTKYIEFWLHFIGVHSITAMTVEHTWDGRALDMIDEGRSKQQSWQSSFESHAGVPSRSRQCRLILGRRECCQEAGLGVDPNPLPHPAYRMIRPEPRSGLARKLELDRPAERRRVCVGRGRSAVLNFLSIGRASPCSSPSPSSAPSP